MGAAAEVGVGPVGKGEGGGGVGREREGEAVGGLVPVGEDGAVGRVVFDVEMGEGGVEAGLDGEVVEAGAGGVGVDAGGATVDPRHDGAEGVVVVGVHGGVAGVAVPALPPGGGAFADHVAPGRIGGGEEEFEGEIGVLVFVEHEHEKGRAEEAGGEMVAMGFDVLGEAVDHGGAECGRGDASEEGGEVRGLGVAFNAAVVFDERGAVGGDDVVVLLLIFLGVGGASVGRRRGGGGRWPSLPSRGRRAPSRRCR